jgi:phosphopantothenoylcysteine decarboxylase/phosphopantothenate--cysteine ligase
MDTDMLIHPSTQRNIETLRNFGNHILEPATGELASGLSGKGRMAEPEEILKEISNFLAKKKMTL